jgi:lipopolysaccharide biosynthesis protein
VNDSIVGPLSADAFDTMMARIEASDADVVGLTANAEPIPHLQSFFLVFGPRVLASPHFDELLRNVRNLGDKGQVVDIYELRTTRTLREKGFTTHALYDALPDGRVASDDLLGYWREMLDAGFPYVKTRVLQAHRGNKRLQAVRDAACVDNQI